MYVYRVVQTERDSVAERESKESTGRRGQLMAIYREQGNFTTDTKR